MATPLDPPHLTIEQKRRRIERLQECIEDLEAFDPQQVQKRFGVPEVLALEAAIDGALSAAFGHGTPAYNLYKRAAKLDHGGAIAASTLRLAAARHGVPVNIDAQRAHEAQRIFSDGKDQSIGLLQQAIRTLEHEIADAVLTPAAAPVYRDGNQVFVVHGHDEAALQAVARFLEQLGLEAIILREQPDAGRTIIEKFEDCAADVGFAVVLLTPDDLAGPVISPAAASRARQNVIFELGYFAGKLGRGRACLLRKGEIEIPSDLYGVIYTDMDAADGWKIKLVRELKAANLDFDANRMWT
jgi:predicted nucleotide-binding protein